MAKPRRKTDTRGPMQRLVDAEALAERQSGLDVITQQQAASGDYEPNGGRRYFRLQMIDRLHRNGKLTYAQHKAGEWYREQWDAGRYDAAKTSDWTRSGSGNVVPIITITIAQQRARDNWHAARKMWPTGMLGFMERLLLHNSLPKRHHRAAARDLAAIRNALDEMARYLRYVP